MSFFEWLEGRPPAVVPGLAIATVAGIAGLDYATGEELAFSVFYLAPIIATAWAATPAAAAVVAVAAGAAFPLSDALAGETPSSDWVPFWNFAVRTGTYLVVAGLTGALRRALQQERELARVDSLTGALNARSFREVTDRELARARRTGRPLTAAYVDLDGFKAVNDTFGHSAGDDVLKQVSHSLRAGTRPADIVGRVGGDEFALIFPETDAEAAAFPLRRIRSAVAEVAARLGYGISASIGAATFLGVPEDVDALLRAADELMYEAKHAGKGRIEQRIVPDAAASGAG